MENTQSITPNSVPQPLSDFAKIGYNTYLYTSPTYSPPKSPLILFFAWNAAAAKHIAKYTVAYQRLFPTARIVLIRCYTGDMFKSAAKYQTLHVPALDVTKEYTRTGGEILVHSFSNGGGNQVAQFMKVWKSREGTVLPIRAHILDSSPGKGGWTKSHAAIVASLPPGWFWRLFGSLTVHLVLFLTFVFDKTTGRENMMTVICRELNDPAFFDTRAPRVYLYSKADQMVGFEEVEEHADEGAAKGFEVTKVRFEKSAHAGHVREDEAKYWGAVMEAWKRGPNGARPMA